MSLIDKANYALIRVRESAITELRADPVSAAPQVPGGTEGKAQAGANSLYGVGLWAVIVIAALATLGAGAKIFLDHQEGRKNPGIGSLATIFGGVIVALIGASLVGTVSGT